MKLPEENTLTDVGIAPDVDPAIVDFHNRYSLALRNWIITHGRTPPPVYVDPIDGKMKWANRAMRRRAAKGRGLKTNAHNYK